MVIHSRWWLGTALEFREGRDAARGRVSTVRTKTLGAASEWRRSSSLDLTSVVHT